MPALERFAPPPGPPPPPAAGEVDVWAVPLDPPEAEVAALARLLAPDEAERAERFRFERHRRRYTVGRGVLRTLLGRYHGVPPRAVAFGYGAKGKPFLAEPAAGAPARHRAYAPLHFNLSNSEELALVAFCREAEVGADLERLRPMPDCLHIAERFFSAAERQALAAQPPEELDRAFFRCWTRKEAYLKAVGDGITAPLDAFDVTLAPGEPPRMLSIDGDPGRAAAWELVHVEPAAGYLGALALPARPGGWRLRGWRWSG
jgi:4'-phosphopantetheinyl transferase